MGSMATQALGCKNLPTWTGKPGCRAIDYSLSSKGDSLWQYARDLFSTGIKLA